MKEKVVLKRAAFFLIIKKGWKFYTESEYAENGQTLADYDETGENKTEYEYISGTNVVRTQKNPNGSKFSYGYDVDDTVTSITQSTEEGEENSTQTRYTCGEVACPRGYRMKTGRSGDKNRADRITPAPVLRGAERAGDNICFSDTALSKW